MESSTDKALDISAATSLKERLTEKSFPSIPIKRNCSPRPFVGLTPAPLIEPIRSDDEVKRDAALLLEELFVSQSKRWSFDTTGGR